MNNSFKHFIRKNTINFKRWIDKPNRIYRSPYEKSIIKSFCKIINSESSDCFVDLKLNKRYIENSKNGIFIILFNNTIIIIYKSKIELPLCEHSYILLSNIFDSKLSFKRNKKEEKYLKDTYTFFEELNVNL